MMNRKYTINDYTSLAVVALLAAIGVTCIVVAFM